MSQPLEAMNSFIHSLENLTETARQRHEEDESIQFPFVFETSDNNQHPYVTVYMYEDYILDVVISPDVFRDFYEDETALSVLISTTISHAFDQQKAILTESRRLRKEG